MKMSHHRRFALLNVLIKGILILYWILTQISDSTSRAFHFIFQEALKDDVGKYVTSIT